MILDKPASLSGLEFQFLRKTAGLTTDILARKLGVVPQTVGLWEASLGLRLTNDITARIVFGAALFGESYRGEMPKLFESISQSRKRISEIKIRWAPGRRRWEWLGSSISDRDKYAVVTIETSWSRRLDSIDSIRPTIVS